MGFQEAHSSMYWVTCRETPCLFTPVGNLQFPFDFQEPRGDLHKTQGEHENYIRKPPARLTPLQNNTINNILG